jgi:hypothetical protein
MHIAPPAKIRGHGAWAILLVMMVEGGWQRSPVN